jgi:hypothetical protein
VTVSIVRNAPDADETDTTAAMGFGRRLLFERFRAEPNRSHAMIYYWPSEHRVEGAMLTVAVILTERSVQRIFDMYKIIHLISVDFSGLPVTAHPSIDEPSIPEFVNPDLLSRKAYFSKRVSFSFSTPRLTRR